MYRTVINIPKFSFLGSKQKIGSYYNCSPKELYQKMFLSHIQKEECPDWHYKNGTKIFASHPCMKYNVTIVNKTDSEVTNDVYAISLLPINLWLVKERGRIMELKDASIGNIINKLFSGKMKFLESNLSANFIAEILSNVCPTGLVVDSFNHSKPLVVIGDIRIIDDQQMVLVPHHKGFPDVIIFHEKHSVTLAQRSGIRRNNAVCQIIQWEYLKQPIGRLLPKVPMNYDPLSIFNFPDQSSPNLSLEETINKLLEHFGIQDKPFSVKSLACVPKNVSEFKSFSQEERKKRVDFSDKIVFTIDPVDAKDLDDALHIEKQINSDFYELGVHIADVSHFVKSGTSLDNEALSRANSVYLINKCIPMLPEVLSEQLCSLNPDEEKLSFSVLFILDSKGNIISEQFMKSFIKPKMRLNYEQATNIINGITVLELESNPCYRKVAESLKIMDKLATIIRNRRVEGGAIVLNKIEVRFSCEPTVYRDSNKNIFPEPIGFKKKNRGSSDILVEEFMLLANQASANLLFKHLISKRRHRTKIGALLRNHPPPDKSQMIRLTATSQMVGIEAKISNCKEIQKKINFLTIFDPTKALCLSYVTYLNMQLAQYCCAEDNVALNDPNQQIKLFNGPEFPFHHFGLNVPLYTHFTSPIRRYSDIIVHRQIEAIIKDKNKCETPLSQRLEAAHNCNMNRISSRRMNEQLTTIYMAFHLNKIGWRLTKAIILNLHANDLTILIPFCGIIHRCEMMHFVPWAFGFEMIKINKEDSMNIQLKYALDDNCFHINYENGFKRYEYKWEENNEIPITSSIADKRNQEIVLQKERQESSLIRKLENCMEDNESENEFSSTFSEQDKLIDNLRLQAKQDNKVNLKLNSIPFSSFNVNFFHELDCVIYCSKKKLQLHIELLFPKINLEEILKDKSKII